MQTNLIDRRVKLHRKQQAFRRSSARFRGFVGGRGSGKSFAGAYDLIRRAKRDRTYLVAGPTYPMLASSTVRSFLHVARLLGVFDPKLFKRSPPMQARLTTGAVILFHTAEGPEKLRGPNLSGVWLDEASLMVKDAYLISLACLREAGEPGWLSATFTPKGTAHWTYEVFGTAQPGTELFHATTGDNPFLPQDFAGMLAGQYGADSGFARQEVGGEFVDAEDGWQVIPTSWIRAAQARWTESPPEGQALTCIGADVAMGGADCTAVVARYGPWFSRPKKYRGESTDTGEKAAHLILREWKGDAPVHVDSIGIGAACYQELRKVIGKKLAVPVNVAVSPDPAVFDKTRKYKMVNLRAAMFWRLREDLDPQNGRGLMLPPDQEVLADLAAPRFEVRSSGILIEPKVDIKERLGRSPDVGDAIALANWHERKAALWVKTAEDYLDSTGSPLPQFQRRPFL